MDKQLHAGIATRSNVTARRLGPLSRLRLRRELRIARREADEELVASIYTTPRTAWRAAELTSHKNRATLARSIERLIDSADARHLPGPTPLNRIAVREQADRLRQLADLIRGPEVPVTARGLLLIDRLLTDGYGPLYVSYRAIELPDVLSRCFEALVPQS